MAKYRIVKRINQYTGEKLYQIQDKFLWFWCDMEYKYTYNINKAKQMVESLIKNSQRNVVAVYYPKKGWIDEVSPDN